MAGALLMQDMERRPAHLPPHAASVVLFWRADCAPCLLELADLPRLRAEAKPLSVTPVALQPAEEARTGLRKVGLSEADTLISPEAPETVLTRYGGAPPRLPLAVAFDASGRLCGRRSGLLGYAHLRQWARSCGGADAARR